MVLLSVVVSIYAMKMLAKESKLLNLVLRGFSLKKWVGPFFEGKALGTRLKTAVFVPTAVPWFCR